MGFEGLIILSFDARESEFLAAKLAKSEIQNTDFMTKLYGKTYSKVCLRFNQATSHCRALLEMFVVPHMVNKFLASVEVSQQPTIGSCLVSVDFSLYQYTILFMILSSLGLNTNYGMRREREMKSWAA
jgi:hypothetical protein